MFDILVVVVFEDYRTIIIVELSLSLRTSNQNIYETYF